MKIPILFLIFNRKDIAIQSFKSIKNYQPTKLYIAADGPRQHKIGEINLCDEVRKEILNEIDWECQLHTLFRSTNLGCDKAIPDSINWFFQTEDYGIIIEDDCYLHSDFYTLCELLLPKYENENKIMQISAFNPTPNENKKREIYFTNTYNIWGWATWKRAWCTIDFKMQRWRKYPKYKLFINYGLFYGVMNFYYWTKTYKKISSSNATWDSIWSFNILSHDGLSMQSYINLSKNCGTNIDGTHFSKDDKDIYEGLPLGNIEWPLILPQDISLTKEQIKKERQTFKKIRIIGIKKKIKQIIKKL